MSAYDDLAKSGYMRAKEDYLVGMNYSRVYTLLYGNSIKNTLKMDKCVISIGRVMTCVLGLIVNREREVSGFTKTPSYGVKATLNGSNIEALWKADDTSSFVGSPLLYNENGFIKKSDAETLLATLQKTNTLTLVNVAHKEEKKYAPLLYNLAELQSDCAKQFKISPDETLEIAQKLYESKRITYPRTDARVLSTAICKEITKNLSGLANIDPLYGQMIAPVMAKQTYQGIEKSKYCDDSKISDHYAIIPTGQNDPSVSYTELENKVYDLIARRFIAIFYPCTVYDKCTALFKNNTEPFYCNLSGVKSKGFLLVSGGYDPTKDDTGKIQTLSTMSVGASIPVTFEIREMETKPPTRFTSGSIILAMENAGKLIEDDALREQIKGSGIGTSATRGEILKKLVKIGYIDLNKKTQVLTPTALGNEIVKVVEKTVPDLLSPKMTAVWEKGLDEIAKGTLSDSLYYDKLKQTIENTVQTLIKNTPTTPVASQNAPQGKIVCPLCKKGEIRANTKAYYCTEYKNGCNLTIWKESNGGKISFADVNDIATNGQSKPIQFRKKDRTTYKAVVYLDNGKMAFKKP